MDNIRPEGTEYQSVTYLSGEALRRNVHVRRSKSIRKSPQQYDPVFGSVIECNNDDVENYSLYDPRWGSYWQCIYR